MAKRSKSLPLIYECSRCGRVRYYKEFYLHPVRRTRMAACKDCHNQIKNAWIKQRRQNNPKQQELDRIRARQYYHRKRKFEKDKRHARGVVLYAVKTGRMPPAKSLKCSDCHKMATQYDHHLGYDYAHRLHVQPVCYQCHGRRSRRRKEHKHTGRML